MFSGAGAEVAAAATVETTWILPDAHGHAVVLLVAYRRVRNQQW